MNASGDLGARLRGQVAGAVLTSKFDLGRYATDASIYQVMPRAVVVPQSTADVEAVLTVSADTGTPVLPRGAGTSQAGQTVNDAIVMDTTVHLNKLLELDVANRTCVVEPGIVLDELNRQLAPHGLWFPVDISTASRATIGGMTANNSCGGRSLRYGTMRHNVEAIDALMADGQPARFEHADTASIPPQLARSLLAIGTRDAEQISQNMPDLVRRVGGYNLDVLLPDLDSRNFAELLVGSEGTLAYFSEIKLKLAPLLGPRGLAVCHFPTFAEAMEATQHLVSLSPIAVELVDDTMIELARSIPLFKSTLSRFVRGQPGALLLTEFAEASPAANAERLEAVEQRMAELGYAWQSDHAGGSLAVTDPKLQGQIAEIRKSGLNIMMSMKQAGKPVSFVEDCAVALPDLAAYTAGLTKIFSDHGTTGTWYAHASVGCLHVRPILNLKKDSDVKTLRAIAEQTFDLVKQYKGSHSGEHGDGIVRSEFHEKMFGPRLTAAFAEIKELFDPNQRLNPGRIVNPPKMDDRRLFRYGPDYHVTPMVTALDWSDWPGAGDGFQGAVEMCNNNGACRKLAGGVMCPSFRVTRQENDSTRGRANTLRLAISGQLGSAALHAPEMVDAMRLCVSCKGCRRECPTGVDMARMKIEVTAAQVSTRGLSLHQRLVGYLPDYAPWLHHLAGVLNLRNRFTPLARMLESPTGMAAARSLPRWHARPFRDAPPQDDATVVLFADTFNRYFEPDNLRAAQAVLHHAGYRISSISNPSNSRPLCCGRTYLSAGLIDKARVNAENLVAALKPAVEAGQKIVGLEPSCVLTLRDELPALLPGKEARLIANNVLLFEEFVSQEHRAGRLNLELGSVDAPIHLHGHCHQKAFGLMDGIEQVIELIPDARVHRIDSGCCGMAGAFGYAAETHALSMQMGELALFPAVRNAPSDAIIVADGTSCRHQIHDGTGREAIHVAELLYRALANGSKPQPTATQVASTKE